VSAKQEPIVRTCNFCCSGMTNNRPVPKALVISRSQYFQSKRFSGHIGASADFRLEIDLRMNTGSDADMCLKCEKELTETEIAIRKVLRPDVIEGEISIKVGEAKAAMRDEIEKFLSTNFEAMYDAMMLVRRARRASPRHPERG